MTNENGTDASQVPYRDAMRELISERWDGVWKAVPVAMKGEDPEGVHDVRVASRRLRAAMDVAKDAFPNDWYRPLHKLAKQITRELGAVRDRDVLIEALQKDREAAPPEQWPGIDLVISRIDRERQEARAEMERFLADLETSGMIDETRRRFGRPEPAPEPGAGKKRKRAAEAPQTEDVAS
jgi:CHAD domain-containing protein